MNDDIALSFATSQGEYLSMKRALQEKRNRSGGFQGCVNKEKCGFEGFYLCRYSEEGLCKNCEIEQFPERYHGCMFCRRPQMYIDVCLECKSGFENWVEKYTDIIEKSHCYITVHRLCSNENKIVNHKFIIHPAEPIFYKWPGFYCGEKKWIIPEFTNKLCSSKEITYGNSSDLLLELLETNGIHIYNEIQYNGNT
jgi:hypothetical protein